MIHSSLFPPFARYAFFFCAVFIFNSTILLAQNKETLKSVTINGSDIVPHRIELKETTFPDTLDAWVYLTTEPVQGWGEEHLMIQWNALTWNGTGIDMNMADLHNLGLKSRITPFGAPAGSIIESHYFEDSVSVAEANADYTVKKRPAKHLGPGPYYNIILWPYVFASIVEKDVGSFVLPGYSPYTNISYFYRVDVKSDTTIVDQNGTEHSARIFQGRSTKDLSVAHSKEGPESQRITRFFISDEAPYFLGKEILTQSDTNDSWEITKRWQLIQWTLLSVSPTNHVDEILNERKRRLTKSPQSLPWKSN